MFCVRLSHFNKIYLLTYLLTDRRTQQTVRRDALLLSQQQGQSTLRKSSGFQAGLLRTRHG